MKKRTLSVILITLMTIMMSTAFAFAGDGDLQLVSSYPEDGQKNTSIENVGVKLQFATDVDSDEALAANTEHVKIVDKDGNQLPLKVLAKGKQVLVLGDSTADDYSVESNAEYKLVIDPEFRDNDGNTIGTETTLTFQTFNQKVNNYINMAMMFVMFGGIMFATVRQQAQQAEGGNDKKDEKAQTASKNPYKEAKRTGKSVEEIVAAESERKEKVNAKAEKQAAKEEAIREKLRVKLGYDKPLPNVYKVKAPAPVSAAGSKSVSGRGASKNEPKRQQSKTRQKASKKK